MKNYYFSEEQELTQDTIIKILTDFQGRDFNLLKKRYNYYIGKQPILQKVATDVGKKVNKVVVNFINEIVATYQGYCVGLPVTYSSEDNSFETLFNVLKYNDVAEEDSELFKNGLVFGRSAEITYIDKEKKTRFKALDPETVIPIYANTLDGDLIYVIRFYEEQLTDADTPVYIVEVYSKDRITTYRSGVGFASLEFIKEERHNFGDVPIVIFSLNKEEQSVAEQVWSLQDAYNTLYSDGIDDWESFCDAYMVIKGMTADEEDLKRMKEHRVLIMDSDADASYLVKDVSTTEIENLLDNTEDKIREISACPDFSQENFGTSSGIQYRCMALENKASSIMTNFKKALQRRIELLSNIEKLVQGEEVWRDVDIDFTRNIPVNYQEIYQNINLLRGLVSDETLLSQVPFVDDVDEEVKKIEKQRELQREIYSFGLQDVVEDKNEE